MAEKSICIIEDDNGRGTGVLIKLPLPSRENPMFGLITNNHLLNEWSLKQSEFDIYVNDKFYEIKLNESNFKFTSDLIDITFVQITDDVLINNKNLKFIELNNCDIKEGDKIKIIQYPIVNKTNTLQYSEKKYPYYSSGKIKYLCGFSYFHSGSTKSGSSGSPLINDNMKIIGIHNSGIPSIQLNIATSINIVYNAINVFFNINSIYRRKNASKSAKDLDNNINIELINHGLEKTILPNVFLCPYSNKLSKYIILFYRTNHGWYWTSELKKNIIFDEEVIKIYNWSLINPYESIEKNIENFNGKLEHRHKVIMTWLKLSEFMYI